MVRLRIAPCSWTQGRTASSRSERRWSEPTSFEIGRTPVLETYHFGNFSQPFWKIARKEPGPNFIYLSEIIYVFFSSTQNTPKYTGLALARGSGPTGETIRRPQGLLTFHSRAACVPLRFARTC